MKSLQPSHRENKRYLLITGHDARKDIIEDVLFEGLGILGYSELGIHFIDVKPGKIIFAINREVLEKVRASFLLSSKDLKIERVSGSVKKVKN